MHTYKWQGASGRWYDFEVARARRAWEPTGGIYMFVKPPESMAHDWGGPISLFIGRCESFALTLARHEMWQAAEQLGAREVHLLAIRDPQTRERVEADILEAQRPILNRNQLRRVA